MPVGEEALQEKAYEIEVEIKNSDGLHMRPAMQLVDLANQFECDITVSNNQDTADAKSIMQVTVLAATCGTKLKIKTEGTNAKQAIEALKELVEQKLFAESAPDEQEKNSV